ncbi:MAG: hypothetical protein MHM6MM_008022 [Cercozoa sp. M6MM]
MKVKTISRNDRDYQRQNKLEVHKVQRNYAPELHQFERAREYTRALAATKLDKVFAKPFVAALDAHEDGITSMTTVPGSLGYAVTGAADGEVICWHLKNRELLWRTRAHSSLVRGVTVDRNGKVAVTVGQDGSIHAWALDREVDHLGVTEHGVGRGREVDALHSYETQSQLTEVDYTWDTGSHVFATSGEQVSLWDLNRSTPVHSFTWGIDTVRNVRFNRVQHSVLASVGADRSIVLYDTRQRSALRKVTLRMQSNDLCWNPREAFNFSVACEDHRAYTFDMRKLNRALNVHKVACTRFLSVRLYACEQDHVNAVLSIDYSPTGREFVTGSYDRTVRIFDARNGHSRDVFHTQRMQRVFAVRFSQDSKYVLSGSDDANLRIWKSNAAQQRGVLSQREREKHEYHEQLKKRYMQVDEVRRIARHRHLPKAIKKQQQAKHLASKNARIKEERVRRHTKNMPRKRPERSNHIVKEHQ